MLLRHGRDPRPVWRAAMVGLLAFFAMTLVARSVPRAWEDPVDGIRGFLLGVTLVLMFDAGRLQYRSGRRRSDPTI